MSGSRISNLHFTARLFPNVSSRTVFKRKSTKKCSETPFRVVSPPLSAPLSLGVRSLWSFKLLADTLGAARPVAGPSVLAARTFVSRPLPSPRFRAAVLTPRCQPTRGYAAESGGKFTRSKPHFKYVRVYVCIAYILASVPSAMSTTVKPPLPRPSPSTWRNRAVVNLWTTARSTKLLRRKLEVSPLALP